MSITSEAADAPATNVMAEDNIAGAEQMLGFTGHRGGRSLLG